MNVVGKNIFFCIYARQILKENLFLNKNESSSKCKYFTQNAEITYV